MSADRRPDRRPPLEDWPAMFAAIRLGQAAMDPLDFDGRIALLCALLTQEICTLPGAERRPELDRLIDDLPGILEATECGMRQALADNARRGI